MKRSEHALADVEELHGLFADTGFADICVETVVRIVRFASVAAYVRVQFAATPLAALLAGRDPAARERLVALVIADVSARLAPYVHEGDLAFPQEVHIARATA